MNHHTSSLLQRLMKIAVIRDDIVRSALPTIPIIIL